MLGIQTDKLGKRYNNQWIFKALSYQFTEGQAYALFGNNGSGKSTLLKVLAGFERFTEGECTYQLKGQALPQTELYKHISLCAPYQSLYDDLNLAEHYKLHTDFKPLKTGSLAEFEELLALPNTKKKALKHFSSGMRQRVKLALAILSDCPFLFLDEPTSNLDAISTTWYKGLILNNLQNRIVVVASNLMEDEIFFCQNRINIADYKHIKNDRS